MEVKKIAIGCDHAGFPYKNSIINMLEAQGIEIKDFGTYSEDSVDYPDFVHPVADQVEQKEVDLGVVLCGSGNGVAMTANKHQGIRCALCWNESVAELARSHNNANIIAIPMRFVQEDLALKMMEIFIRTDFEGGRHERRVGKIPINC